MNDEAQQPKEIVLRGIGVSSGVVVSKVFLRVGEEERIVERAISADEIPREIARFEDALITTRCQLHDIQKKVSEGMGHESASIFDAHLLVVDDRAFVEEVIRTLEEGKKNVEAVLDRVSEKYAKALSEVDDDYLRERATDVRDVTRRILRNLSGQTTTSLADISEPCVVVSDDLSPSETATMNTDNVIGFATDLGSRTSHTAIMARALEIPAVVGLHDVTIRVSNGDVVLIDGTRGVLIVHPTRERLEEYGKVIEARKTIHSELANLKDQPSETLDGYSVMLSANIELPGDVDSVLANGAKGVGLFRSEFVYLSQDSLPTEDEQAGIYGAVAEQLASDPVIIRTVDLGGDKFASSIKTPDELNPFMGWRAIRFCLAQPAIFKTQLRAILRASVQRNVQIMYPMVSNVDEVIQANTLLEEAKTELRARGVPFDEDINVGVMIEVPSAALTADLIAPYVNFFSLGTNDLVQYTLAVDRVNERIAYLYEPTHPAILKLIKNTIDIGHQYGIWTGVCGEMAGNPIMVPLLIGLGADELSASPALVPVVKDAIRSIKYSQAEALANQALASESGAEVLELCRDLIRQAAPEILKLVD